MKKVVKSHCKDFANHLLSVAIITVMLLTLMTPVNPVQAASQQADQEENYPILTYWVGNMNTREDRTAVAGTGADIIEIGVDYVIVNATETEAKQIANLGYPMEQIIRTQDFPPVDSAYHN